MNYTCSVSSGGVTAELVRYPMAPQGHHFGVHIQPPVSLVLQPESGFCCVCMKTPAALTTLTMYRQGLPTALYLWMPFSGSLSWKRSFEKIQLVSEVKAMTQQQFTTPRILPQSRIKEEVFSTTRLGSYQFQILQQCLEKRNPSLPGISLYKISLTNFPNHFINV